MFMIRWQTITLKIEKRLSNIILEHYPGYMEKILYKSLLKMKKASQEKIIDYVLLKCSLDSNIRII